MRQIRQAVLVGPRLCLRPLRVADVNGEYLRWLNDPQVTRYLEVGGQRSTHRTVLTYLKRFHRSKTDRIFSMIDQETGQHIGNVAINRIRSIHGTADTGLMIGRKEMWGRGYAFEAWSLILEYAFRALGVRKMIAGAVTANKASIATLRKLGFKQEGRFRQEFFVNGVYEDVVRFGLFKEEWLANRSRLNTRSLDAGHGFQPLALARDAPRKGRRTGATPPRRGGAPQG